MESKVRSLGSSIKVPVVQELAKEKLSSVPPRYIRPDQDPLIPSHLSSSPQIPVVDLHNLFHPNLLDSELHKLHHACQQWGFFQLINHGVNSSVIETMKLEIQEFFNLPVEEKNKFRQEAGVIEGYGQGFVVSEDQKLDWADLFAVTILPAYFRTPHLMSKLPAKFRNAIEAYAEELKVLEMKLLKHMAKALGMKYEEMGTFFEEGMQTMRMNYYPPCPQPELVTGLCPHSDSGSITILLQVNEMEGLQIKKDGAWVPVSPLPNAFVINIGDTLEIVTNGTYRSIEHRAMVNTEKERLSIATFFGANLEADIYPAPSLVTPETPAKFKRISAADYFKGYLSKELKGKSHLDTIRI